MQKLWKAGLIALLALFILGPGGLARAADRGGDRDGGFAGRGDDFRGFYDPDFYPGYYGWGWGLYNPWYEGSWGSPYFFPAYTGTVKIITKRKNASVYVDHGYVGRAGKVKKIRLRPGLHVIQLRNSAGRVFYQKRVYIVRGKTIKLDAKYANVKPRGAPLYNRRAPASPLKSAASPKARTGYSS